MLLVYNVYETMLLYKCDYAGVVFEEVKVIQPKFARGADVYPPPVREVEHVLE